MSKTLKLFFSYVIPSMVGMLVVGSYSIIDTIFIAQAGGEQGLAAVSLTLPVIFLFGALGDMLGAGAGVIIAQEKGKNNLSKARSVFGNMLMLQVVVSCIAGISIFLLLPWILRKLGAVNELFPLAYTYARILVCGNIFAMLTMALTSVIRNDQRPFFAMFLTILSLVSNIVLDYVLMFRFDFGVHGAAYATLISQALSVFIAIGYFLSPFTKLGINFKIFKISFSYMKEIFIVGIPSLGNHLAIIAMLFCHNYQALNYKGVSGLAAYTFIGTIESMGSLLMTGLALGVQPLVAFLHGKKYYRQQRRIGVMGYYASFILGSFIMCFLMWGSFLFASYFNLSQETLLLASKGLVISAFSFLFLGVVRVACYYYQATGKVLYATSLIYGDAFLVLPLCLFLLPLKFGIDGVWLAMPISKIIMFLYVLFLWFGVKRK